MWTVLQAVQAAGRFVDSMDSLHTVKHAAPVSCPTASQSLPDYLQYGCRLRLAW